MQKNVLILGTYNHFPEGTPEEKREHIYQNSYRPFLYALNAYTDIQACAYYSGTVYSWLESKHPEFIMLLSELIARKQLEILGGAYHAPLLPLIPQTDRLGQIEALTLDIRKNFGKRARGAWLAEYAWEQSLVGPIKASGMDYVFLSLNQFSLAGLSPEEQKKPVITQDQGKSLIVFPVRDDLSSHFLPFEKRLLQTISARPVDNELFCLFYKGESIGMKNEREQVEETICSFFDGIRSHALELETMAPVKYVKNIKNLVRTHFPDSCSKALSLAACSPSKIDVYKKCMHTVVRNGIESEENPIPVSCRSILTQYSDVYKLYSKMQYVHLVVNQLRGDKARKKSAREEMWKAQSHDYYWQNGSGGIQLKNYRVAAYRSLLIAEKIARDKGTFIPSIINADFDFDGMEEYLMRCNDLDAYIHCSGASLFEFDDILRATNYVDNFCLTNQAGRGNAFVDSIYSEPVTLECLKNNSKHISFASVLFSVTESARTVPRLVFRKDNLPLSANDDISRINIQKSYSAKKGEISLSYSILNTTKITDTRTFVVEIPLSLPDHKKAKIEISGSSFTKELTVSDSSYNENISSVSISTDKKHGIVLNLSKPCTLALMPVEAQDEISASRLFIMYPLGQKEGDALDFNCTLVPHR